MSAWFRFIDWPLRARIVALLVAASLVPLGIATWTSVHNARADLYRNTGQLLQARASLSTGSSRCCPTWRSKSSGRSCS